MSAAVSATKEKFPWMYDLCPLCGSDKMKTSSQCSACRNAKPTLVQPDDLTMRYIPLSREYVAIVDAEDYERVSRFNWSAEVSHRKDRSVRTVYGVRMNPGNQIVRLHRFILGITDARIEVDHRDGNGLNCQRYNLRTATRPQNGSNTRKMLNNTSGFKGVSWHKGYQKWESYICDGGVKKHLGWRDLPEDAARLYDVAAVEAFGEFAHLNFPMEVSA